MKELLSKLFSQYKIKYSEEMLAKLDEFYKIVIEENQKINLTAITNKNDFAVKHILDSVLPQSLLPIGAKIIDVGAGAGFPSLPLKILRPDLNITMLDSLQKRVNFLNDTIAKLKLTNINAYHGRAEDFVNGKREQFDIAIARAVANLNTLAEYCLPYVKVGGIFIAMKGAAFGEEMDKAKNAIKLLGGELSDIQKYTLVNDIGIRANLCIKKVSVTNNIYPRGKNLPRLKPLT